MKQTLETLVSNNNNDSTTLLTAIQFKQILNKYLTLIHLLFSGQNKIEIY